MKKQELSQDIYDLYDDYAHNKIERRQFIDKLSMFAVGGLTVTKLKFRCLWMIPDLKLRS